MISYQEQAALASDQVFRGRVQISCIRFADYISLEAASVPAHVSRAKWAASVVTNPVQVAAQVQQVVVTDPAVAEAGAEITDAALQAAVETTVQTKFI